MAATAGSPVKRPKVVTVALNPDGSLVKVPESPLSVQPSGSLLQRYHARHESLSGITVDLQAIKDEARILEGKPNAYSSSPTKPAFAAPTSPGSLWSLASTITNTDKPWGSAIMSMGDIIKGYVPASMAFLAGGQSTSVTSGADRAKRRGCWGRTADELVQDSCGGVPKLLVELKEAILGQCISTEGIFRRSSSSPLLPAIVALLDIPLADQPTLPWSDLAKEEALLPPKALLRIFGQMVQPVIEQKMYGAVRQANDIQNLKDGFLLMLPPANRILLDHLVETLYLVAQHEATTRMSPLALAIVVAPTLIAGPDPLEDATMCLAPGKQLPAGMLAAAGGSPRRPSVGQDAQYDASHGDKSASNSLVGVLELWIKHWPELQDSTARQVPV